jgi:class 3 adenylate cyclase
MNAPPVERKLAAILSADVAGYSRLMTADEAGTLAALSAHRETIAELIGQRNGRIAGTAGDSVMAEFPSVVEAVQCAVEIQQAATARNADIPEDRRMLFRIGINVGDVMVKDDDIFGDGVNVAARLQALAPPGGICISRAVRDQLRDKSLFAFVDRGEQALKNIARPVRVFEVQFEGSPPPTAPGDVPAGATAAAQVAVADVAGGSPEAAVESDPAVELAFWDSIKESDRAADFAAYLERFPGGHFTTLARTRLSGLTAAKAAEGSDEVKLEIAYWESVKDSDDPAMFRAYLDKYPDGHFKELAETRLAQLAKDDQTDA